MNRYAVVYTTRQGAKGTLLLRADNEAHALERARAIHGKLTKPDQKRYGFEYVVSDGTEAQTCADRRLAHFHEVAARFNREKKRFW